jgi:hemerythrin-like domain-containing protein
MTRKRRDTQIRDMNVIDMILIDHRFIKECIEILVGDQSDKQQKLNVGRGFLDALQKHLEAEREVVYAPLEAEEEFHFNILEAQIEHGMVDEKIKLLKPRIARSRVLKDEIEAELKVLAELVKVHIKEEESELLPKMNSELEEHMLKQMGEIFMKQRKLTPKDLSDYPQLEDQLVTWKDDVQKVSSQFLSKMDRYVENLKH